MEDARCLVFLGVITSSDGWSTHRVCASGIGVLSVEDARRELRVSVFSVVAPVVVAMDVER